MREVRLLGSTGVTRLPRYYEPVRLPAAADAALWIPPRCCTHVCATPGLPGPSAVLSARALPTHPGRLDECVCSLLPHRSQASPPLQGWPPSRRVTRSNRVRIRWAHAFAVTAASRLARPYTRPNRSVSRTQLPSHAGPQLHGERAIHMTDSFQSASTARVGLA